MRFAHACAFSYVKYITHKWTLSVKELLQLAGVHSKGVLHHMYTSRYSLFKGLEEELVALKINN